LLPPDFLLHAESVILPTDPGTDISGLKLERPWEQGRIKAQLTNHGSAPVRIREVVLFRVPHSLPDDTALYGEGFQMLTQTGGTLGAPEAIGDYTDAGHYKLIPPEGAHSVYGLLTLTPPMGDTLIGAFTSCRRFQGRFDLYPGRIDVVVETEGLELAPGETWDLEEFSYASSPSKTELLDAVAERICANHPRNPWPAPPTGWCSWYCFGPEVTAQNIHDNLEVIAREGLDLKYIQIDDGYQSAMGDWLTTGSAFGGGVENVLADIRKRGFEPAIWVGPFIAERDSELFRNHPDWFIKDDSGAPLPSDRVTFGGWRHGPWYALDGTHPEAQEHLESVFRTMNQEWGCTYFKLDANFWGAMHGGHFHDPKATRVEAYRRGMEAVLRGAGESFILGCNHPIWASFGLIHGSRSSGDIDRSWHAFSHTARENLSRNWQNGTLWWNDPDCLLLTGDLPEDEFLFHATALLASGGMILSGDDLTRISPERLKILRRLVSASADAARLDGELSLGVTKADEASLYCRFNWRAEVTPDALGIELLRHQEEVWDFWAGEFIAGSLVEILTRPLPPQSGRTYIVREKK
jgi:alpha-galactosidase